MQERLLYKKRIKELLLSNPVVALIGPRQVGKTTLARQIAAEWQQVTFFDLENPSHLAALSEPMLALQDLKGLVILDEIQYQPHLFSTLRLLVDRPQNTCLFLVLGSASPELLKQTSQTLAGRVAYLEIKGFSLAEVGVSELDKLWIRGGFPKSFLASSEQVSIQWRQDFIRTFLERDLPGLGLRLSSTTLRRFWMMLAHYHGQIWNGAEFARSFGVSEKTVRHYLDILSSTFIVKQLAPWWENISKRQVKAPKIYLADSGLLHMLLGVENEQQLQGHPKVGASWEGFAMQAVVEQLGVSPQEVFFWRTHTGAEIDLLILHGNMRLGFEFKRTVAPRMSTSLATVQKDLQLSKAYIIHAGESSFPLGPNVQAMALKKILEDLPPLR